MVRFNLLKILMLFTIFFHACKSDKIEVIRLESQNIYRLHDERLDGNSVIRKVFLVKNYKDSNDYYYLYQYLVKNYKDTIRLYYDVSFSFYKYNWRIDYKTLSPQTDRDISLYAQKDLILEFNLVKGKLVALTIGKGKKYPETIYNNFPKSIGNF